MKLSSSLMGCLSDALNTIIQFLPGIMFYNIKLLKSVKLLASVTRLNIMSTEY